MKRPVFPQLDRLIDDAHLQRQKDRRPKPAYRRLPLDELIGEDGRVKKVDDDAE